MGKCTVYTISKSDEIVEQITMDYNSAIGSYWGTQNGIKGRYHIVPEGIECPYKVKSKKLKNVKRKHQEV